MTGENFNIDEIFEIAEQIERNGAKYYRLAAESFSESQHRDFLLEMAAMEDSHEDYFAWLRKRFRGYDADIATIDPGSEGALYLQAIAEGQIFNLNEDPVTKVQGKTFDQILEQAIQAEKDTVLFYFGLKKAMFDVAESKKIEAIIDEEMSHVRILSKRLKEFEMSR